MSGVTAATRRLVLKRANYRCEKCGRPTSARGYSLQHRRARGMGGSRRADTNTPVNLAVLCGSATTAGGCHSWVESNPREAIPGGWRVPQGADPARVPIQHVTKGSVCLTEDGGYSR